MIVGATYQNRVTFCLFFFNNCLFCLFFVCFLQTFKSIDINNNNRKDSFSELVN